MPTITEQTNSRTKSDSVERIEVSNYRSDRKDQKVNRFDLGDKLRLELIFYYLIKIMFATTIVLLSGVENMRLEISTVVILVLTVTAIYVVASLRIPTGRLTPIRRKRTDSRNFLKSEIRFMLTGSALVYFASMNYPSADIASVLGLNFIGQILLFVLWKNYNIRIMQSYSLDSNKTGNKNVLIIGASQNGKNAADLFLRYPDMDTRVIGFIDFHKNGLWRYRDLPLLGKPENIVRLVGENQIDYVIMATEPEDFFLSQQLFETIEQMGIDIIVMPEIYNHKTAEAQASQINGQPVFMYRSAKYSPLEEFCKNLLDKLLALSGLIISSPLLILSALLIKLDSRGPIFFKQKRSGKNGRVFEMIKLRTMVYGADKMKEKLAHLNEMSGPVFKIKNDPRITRVGRILRKFSIDEFPQFINILKGDMSLVGPRPPLPKETADYEPWQRRRLSVKPGATCLWQINGRNNVDFDEWMKLDLKYIDTISIKEDVRIILKTVPAVLKGNGAS